MLSHWEDMQRAFSVQGEPLALDIWLARASLFMHMCVHWNEPGSMQQYLFL
jgi:hypothetical protein